MHYSSPAFFYNYQNYKVPVYLEKNNSKLPDYHRLDANISINLNKNSNPKFEHKLQLSVFNIYARKNIISINYNKIESNIGNFVVPSNYIYENEIFPTKMWLTGIVPMISYSIKY
jgi:hypothetical protein